MKKRWITIFLLIPLVAFSWVSALLIFYIVPYGCPNVKTLTEKHLVDRNEEGYTFTLQIQGAYNPVRFCDILRTRLIIQIPPSTKPLYITSVLDLSLWVGEQRLASIPRQVYPPVDHWHTVITTTGWAYARCASAMESSRTFGADSTLATEEICGP